MSGVISFLGGTAFRWLFGEAIALYKAKQDHNREIQMMSLSHEQEAARHRWKQETIKAHADAGIAVIESQSEATAQITADQMLMLSIKETGKDSGVKWINGFNAFIRPELAQVSIVLLVASAFWPQHVVLTGVVGEVVCAALGLFLGGRIGPTGR